MNAAAGAFDGLNKYIRITDIDEESRCYIDENPVSPKGELDDKYLVLENDILFARTGASTGKTYLYKKSDGKLYFAGFLIRISVNCENNSTFVYNATLTDRYNRWVRLTSMRSGQPGINSQEYSSYKTYYPLLPEQNKIASFLKKLDQRIEKQRQFVELLKSYKRGLSEALFSGKIGRWDLSNIPCGKYKLGELGYFYNGLSGKNKNDFGKGTSQYISYMNVYKNLIADEHILENVIVSATEKQNSVKYGDVLFTQSSETLNEVGYTSVWLSKSTPFLNSFCFGFRFYEQEQTDPYFIAHYFRSSTIRKSIMREGQGATRVNLSSERLKDMVILLPPVHIQKEIGKILNHLEQQIEINAHIEIQLSIYKSRLLQQLFI